MFDDGTNGPDYDAQQNNEEQANYKVILRDVFHSGTLMQRIGTIRVTVNRAKKELEIEQRLNEMKEEWQSMSLLIHEDTRNIAVKSSSSDDTYEIKVIRHASLKNIDDIASLATHQMIDVNKLAASRYSAFRIDDLVHWKVLLRSNEALDKWKMCNRLMSMLLPYFEASSFIKLQGFLNRKRIATY